ncbi:VOC family protein [Leptospira kemamanensis]|nr:VOC family protein [Leptospira kemamanensis]
MKSIVFVMEDNEMTKTNAIGWFDLYVKQLDRATKFYENICHQRLEDLIDPTGETKMKVFTSDMALYGSSGALVESKYQKPGLGGTMVYFSVEDCLLDEKKLKSFGGKLIRQKFSIGNFGFVSICEDSEGNQIGLSSMK